jgi:hypothetical protein
LHNAVTAGFSRPANVRLKADATEAGRYGITPHAVLFRHAACLVSAQVLGQDRGFCRNPAWHCACPST